MNQYSPVIYFLILSTNGEDVIQVTKLIRSLNILTNGGHQRFEPGCCIYSEDFYRSFEVSVTNNAEV